MTITKPKTMKPTADRSSPKNRRSTAMSRQHTRTNLAGKKSMIKAPSITTTEHKRDYIQTVGRRKTAIARLRLKLQGSGQLTINDKDYKQYFPFALWQDVVTEPLPLVGLDKNFDISVKVNGGGLPAQAEAVRLALARALVVHNADWRTVLRKMGYLTRDPREKERKKPGLKRARRAPQWQKR